MALKESGVLEWPTLKRSGLDGQGWMLGYKMGHMALKRADGFKMVWVSNRYVTYIHVYVIGSEKTNLIAQKFKMSLLRRA